MKTYKNLSGNSGVAAYALGADSILVKFKDNPHIYRYSYHRAGARHVEKMKQLAEAGKGLSAYITHHVSDRYDP